MTEAMPFLQKYDITFLRPPTIMARFFFLLLNIKQKMNKAPCGYGALFVKREFFVYSFGCFGCMNIYIKS